MKWDKKYWVHTPVLVQSGKWKGRNFRSNRKKCIKMKLKEF